MGDNNLTESIKALMGVSLLQTKIMRRIDNQLSFHGINFTEFMVLFHLNLSVEHTMRRIDLAERIGLTASGVTRLLAPMEKIGLVQKERNLRDARVSLVKLTKAGKTMFKDTTVVLEHAAEQQTQNLSEKELGQFIRLLDKMLSGN
ncbi:MAG: MarR family winged helix-turn-helix transcriptional regulator [Gammaproteobacteria bacterium]|nr:MarR family winged helix-turn-helix transcriptional regulator [Gammaproteobacteria bacterium]